MIPGEILDNALTCGPAHSLHKIRIIVQPADCGGDCIHIAGLHDNALNSIADDIAAFAGCDCRQAASGRFVNRFCAAFPLRWENIDRALTQVVLQITRKSQHFNIVSRELFQMRPGFLMHRADQPQFRVFQIERVAQRLKRNVIRLFERRHRLP